MNRRKFLKSTSAGIITLPFFNFKLKAEEDNQLKWKIINSVQELSCNKTYLLSSNGSYGWGYWTIKDNKKYFFTIHFILIDVKSKQTNKELSYMIIPEYNHFLKSCLYYIDIQDIIKHSFIKWDDNKISFNSLLIVKDSSFRPHRFNNDQKFNADMYRIIKKCFNKGEYKTVTPKPYLIDNYFLSTKYLEWAYLPKLPGK